MTEQQDNIINSSSDVYGDSVCACVIVCLCVCVYVRVCL